jgi:hypothetical protein
MPQSDIEVPVRRPAMSDIPRYTYVDIVAGTLTASSLDIQRWRDNWYGEDHGEMTPGDDGSFVTYANHLAAVAAAEQRIMRGTYNGIMALEDAFQRGYEQGQRDTETRIRMAVEALLEPNGRRSDEEIWSIDEVLAVIDGPPDD